MFDTALLWVATTSAEPLVTLSMKSAAAAGIDQGKFVFHGAADDAFHEFGAPGFNQFSFERYRVILDLFDRGYDTVVYTDADVVFFRDPLDYLSHCPQVLIQREWPHSDLVLCSGFAVWRNRAAHKSIIDRILREGSFYQRDDQAVLNDQAALARGCFYALDADQFPNGRYYLDRGLPPATPYIFHANWVKGLDAKLALIEEFRHRLRARGDLHDRTDLPTRENHIAG